MQGRKQKAGGKTAKNDEIVIELTDAEIVRQIDDIDGTRPDIDDVRDDTGKKRDVFAKEKDFIVVEKVRQVRAIQASLESSNKWMWRMKQGCQMEIFKKPKRSLEQYVTPIQDALTIGYILEHYIEGKTMADLGAGTGMLGITCVLAGAEKVYFYEIDPEAFSVLRNNCKAILDTNGEDKLSDKPNDSDNESKNSSESSDELDNDEENIEEKNDQDSQKLTVKPMNIVEDHPSYTLLNCDLLNPSANIKVEKVDCVIMNPPFGTSKDEDIDLSFLETAIKMTQGKIFFIHKLTRAQSLCAAAEKFGRKQRILWEFFLEVPRLIFDSADLLTFSKKDKTKDQLKKGFKAGGSKARLQHKKDIEYIRCCLVEWS